MRFSALFALGAATSALATVPQHLQQAPLVDEEKFLIELSPGETRWITEEEKWDLRRNGINFMDISDTQDLGMTVKSKKEVQYPSSVRHAKAISPLLKKLDKKNMRENLETFTSFHTRYYKSSYGAQSSAWLLSRVAEIVNASGAAEYGATVKPFHHPWGQNSIIATIPGRSNKTVVIGAHQDSINLFLPSLLAAPGADDDGSGTVTIFEALRVLLTDKDTIAGKAPNTIEFHWYSAEEGGLLGSQAIFSAYEKSGRDIKAMLQQDMTGYIQKTLDAGEPESVGVITDFVDPGLTEFIKKVITAYCDIPYIETKCGYACSDHASASKAGYPSAFVIESDFKYSDSKIHTTEDKIEYLSFDHMLQHAKLTLGLAYELVWAKFD
ncbi:leucine aminopeptidase 1 [Verruconis gallopava]|uniref:Peptide hydrolase n=1 Tax=Verruconis gallopava TaxID=253628 RepID=A0A0D2AHD5_9PEZI|nr:leucine aminopeptidase 1 [Verruconis gallopava]KIW05960.1 leucine aminopeptidase 1 [Verruconis gallopava]